MKTSSISATSIDSKPVSDAKPLTGKAVRVLADSIYETLKAEGCEEKDIIGVSSQLISLVTANLEQ